MKTSLKEVIAFGATTVFALAIVAATVAAEGDHGKKQNKDRWVDRVTTDNVKEARDVSKVRRPTSRDNRYIGDEKPK